MFGNKTERKVFVLKDGQVYVVRFLKAELNKHLLGGFVFKSNRRYSGNTFKNGIKRRFA